MTTKRIRSSLLAILLCLALCLSLSACGGKASSGNKDNPAVSGSEDKNQAPEDTATEIAVFVDSIQDQIGKLQEAVKDVMNIEVKARGNSLVYSYQYLLDLGVDNETLAGTLEPTLDSMSGTFKSILSALKRQVPGAESVIVEYLAQDGSVILSKEFK